MQLGECDMNQLPMTEGMINSLNAWLEMNNCPTRAAATDSNLIGITADRVYTKDLDGTTYTFAEFDNADGITTMVVVGIEGLPHWVSYSYSKLAWDFMKQYSIVDGKRVYTKASYSDVDPSDTAAAAIETVTEAGCMNGVGGGNFDPDGSVTRAQAITVLGRLAGATSQETAAFTDVQSGSWYSGYVGWAVERGIVEGVGGNRFAPDALVSGADLDLMFERYAASEGLDYINFPAANGETVTRADMAQRLVKLMNAPENYDYEDKDLWFDTTVYGGFYSAYQIMEGNGDDTFDVDAFINSEQGELIMSRIKYELALLGDSQYASQEMIDYWAQQGVIETVYDSDDPEHEWLTYVPEYMYDEANAGKTWPVVFCHHGNGGTLFESTDHGFVHICYDEGFMVVVPENENSDADYTIEMLPQYLDELEANGYPIDRSRVYVAGMSKGGMTSFSVGLECNDVVAAIAPHSATFGMLLEGESSTSILRGETVVHEGTVTQEALDACADRGGIPVWMQLGECDMNQLPMTEGMINSLNAWLEMNNCPTRAEATNSNLIGITADRVYTRELDGTMYTFAEFDNADGITTMVVVGIEGLPHWVSYSYSKLAWDFMSQYSMENGQRVVAD